MYGYTFPDEIFNNAELVTISEEEQRDYLKLKDEHSRIGKGEIECIVVCRKRGFLFSSFDKKAVSMAKDFGVSIVNEVRNMARPIELGLILEGKDAEEFWKNEKSPKVTIDQIKMFEEAMYIRKHNFKM